MPYSAVESEVLLFLLRHGDHLPAAMSDEFGRPRESYRRACERLEDDCLVRNKGHGVRTLTEDGVDAAQELQEDITEYLGLGDEDDQE